MFVNNILNSLYYAQKIHHINIQIIVSNYVLTWSLGYKFTLFKITPTPHVCHYDVHIGLL
jgi:hypothetical protein